MGKTCTCNQEKPKSKQASANLPYLPTRCEARTGLGGWEKFSEPKRRTFHAGERTHEWTTTAQARQITSEKISPSCVGSEKFFSTVVSYEKIQFSSLSLRSANETVTVSMHVNARENHQHSFVAVLSHKLAPAQTKQKKKEKTGFAHHLLTIWVEKSMLQETRTMKEKAKKKCRKHPGCGLKMTKLARWWYYK